MITVNNRLADNGLPEKLCSYLPVRVADELKRRNYKKPDEIRLRCGGACTVTSDGKNLPLCGSLCREEADATLKRLCGGSLYAFYDTINKGYITLPDGIRVGVGGRAVTENGRIVGVYDITTLCIRIPHSIPGIGGRVVRLLRSDGFSSGVLIYSPPGVGKTTLLRSVIVALASGNDAIRVAVIDTRGELSCRLPDGLCVDLLSGYPRGAGIETAARTLNPQLIVCDEIGSELAEAEAIRAAHNCGVPLLATAHAADPSGLLRRTGIALLHQAGIFGSYVGIARSSSADYTYTVTRADALA